MRLVFLLATLVFLTRCSSMSSYDANSDQSNSSLIGSQGGGGVQAPFWSTDPNKTTVTNQNPSQ
jgi:hypothetical protein